MRMQSNSAFHTIEVRLLKNMRRPEAILNMYDIHKLTLL